MRAFIKLCHQFFITQPLIDLRSKCQTVNEHNTLAGHAWIKRGETRALKTHSGRQRLNLHSAIKTQTFKVTIIEFDTVDSYSTINSLAATKTKYSTALPIKVILDNAKYHYSKVVPNYVSEHIMEFIFSPACST